MSWIVRVALTAACLWLVACPDTGGGDSPAPAETQSSQTPRHNDPSDTPAPTPTSPPTPTAVPTSPPTPTALPTSPPTPTATATPTPTRPPTPTPPTDADGDGFALSADCDDSDAAIYPGAPERCNGIDDDCDSVADSGMAGEDAICAAMDCLAILAARPEAEDGVYYLDPDGEGGEAALTGYCDMSTDGGGWLLAAKFSQPSSIQSYPAEDYEAYFRQGLWIKGDAESVPQSPIPEYDDAHVESVDWRRFLSAGEPYRLRQSFFTDEALFDGSAAAHDASWAFVYNGYVSQDDAPQAERAWSLFGLRTHADRTDITWDRPRELTRFWLPFTVNAEGALYSGCNGYQLDAAGCNKSSEAQRRYGNAGIIGEATDGADPGAAWMPHMNASITGDVVWVHQKTGTFGSAGSAMAGLYWIRPERAQAGGDEVCGNHMDEDGDGLIDEGTVGLSEGDAGLDCLEILERCPSGVAEDGLYWVHPPGADVPAQAYCDMSTDGGGWTLLAKFTQPQGMDQLPQADYERLFLDGAWIHGDADGVPLTRWPSYDGYHVESWHWGDFLEAGGRYELRQTAFHEYGSLSFDLSFELTFPGHLLQDDASGADRAWVLSDRRVLWDESRVQWDLPDETVRFWPPFTSEVSGEIYTGCLGFALDDAGCNISDASRRRYGNAGIIGASADSADPAASWAPHMRADRTSDVVFVHQDTDLYGWTGARLGLLYWQRRAPPLEVCGDGQDNDGDGQVDEANGATVDCAAFACADILEAEPEAEDGVYWVDPGQGPVQAYCDMSTEGGGWTLCMRNAGQELELALYESPWGEGEAIADGEALGGIGCGQLAGSTSDILWRDAASPDLAILSRGAQTPLSWESPKTISFSSMANTTGHTFDPATNAVTFKTGSNHLTHTVVTGKGCPYDMILIQPYGYCGGGTGYSFVLHHCGSVNCSGFSGGGVVEVLVR